MTKATVTVLRQFVTQKPIASGLGGMTITEARVHMAETGLTIHAGDVRLRRITSLFLFPVLAGSGVNLACATKLNRKVWGNYASIGIKHIGTQTTGAGSALIADGTNQDYFGIFLGD